MEASTGKKPKTMAELLPDLSGILSKDAIQTLTAKKQPRSKAAQLRPSEVIKPLTIAEMRANIKALRIESPRKFTQAATTTKKKIWNSSVKVDKKISHTADGNMRNNPVRKVLEFQPRSKLAPPSSRMTMKPLNSETPKFPKPEFRPKKSSKAILDSRNPVRISGICNIPETPVLSKKLNIKRMTVADKENISNLLNINKKSFLSPKVCKPLIPDTPLSNESWKSSCDASFLLKEKEINDVEEKAKVITEENTIENIDGVSPPVSTPFKEYRNVTEFFNNSSELENSALYNDNTIMCFDKPQASNEDNNREESVIVSLCDLLNKAKVTNNSEKNSTELKDLLKVEKQTENNIKMIENGIVTLQNIKESQIKSLQCVRKLIAEKNNNSRNVPKSEIDKISVKTVAAPYSIKQDIYLEKSPILGKPCSVIKSPQRSPSYKLPKKNLCLRKKVFHKSMPNMVTPTKEPKMLALNMYMRLKEGMNFLNTPVIKHSKSGCPDTPAVTSHNLQRQLDKLYGAS